MNPEATVTSEASLHAVRLNLLSRFEEVLGQVEEDEESKDPELVTDSGVRMDDDLLPSCEDTPLALPIEELKEAVLACLPSTMKEPANHCLQWHDVGRLAEQLGEYGLFTPDMLAVFCELGLEKLDLQPTLGPNPLYETPRGALPQLDILRIPLSFTSLKVLNLRSIPLHDDDLMHLWELHSLQQLNLSETGISSEAVAYLVALKGSLLNLDLSFNPLISHDVSIMLSYLCNLQELFLDGTSVKMAGLRCWCARIGTKAEMFITVPIKCQARLEKLHRYYVNQIPAPYLDRLPKKIKKPISVQVLSDNLAFHAKADPTIQTNGSVEQLTRSLRDVLRRRKLELTLRRWTYPKAGSKENWNW